MRISDWSSDVVLFRSGLQSAADDWASHCRALCEALDVPLQVVDVDVERDSGFGLEAAARAARRRAFAAALRDDEVLALAHHRDDQAETFLLRALRASGPDGLAAMLPWQRFANGWLWRPLLDVPRASLLSRSEEHTSEIPSLTRISYAVFCLLKNKTKNQSH